jgi:hypothetical protein
VFLNRNLEQVAGSSTGAAVSGPDYYAPRASHSPNQLLTQRHNCVVNALQGVTVLSLTSGNRGELIGQ